MDDADRARLEAIETVLGIMIARMSDEDAKAILRALRTMIDGARRRPKMIAHNVPALEDLDELLRRWSRQAPLLRSSQKAPEPSNDS
ncbi:hypothetical protein [Methylorubrum extorquens]